MSGWTLAFVLIGVCWSVWQLFRLLDFIERKGMRKYASDKKRARC